MDVIVDILLRLPVISLLRFRCVSIQFCTLIDSPEFIRSHLKKSIETKNHRSLILPNKIPCSVDFDSLDSCVELDHHPFKSYRDFDIQVWGSCNGLVCLRNIKDDVLAIWNPSTRKSERFPGIKIDFNGFWGHTDIRYGFGYDSVSDDYKVVKFVHSYYGHVRHSEVLVFTMKSNSWRRIQDFPYYFCDYECPGVLISSALHWFVCQNPSTRYSHSHTPRFVASFDLTNEDYQLMPLPEFPEKNFFMHLVELGGCLCIICCYNPVRNDVWVMKDYGKKESWSKLFSIAPPQAIRSFKPMIPLGYSKSGYEVLLVEDDTELDWYDLENKAIEKIKTPRGMPVKFKPFVHVESLVTLNGEGETYVKNLEDKRKKKKKNRPTKNEKKR